jgi:hypothetical protein
LRFFSLRLALTEASALWATRAGAAGRTSRATEERKHVIKNQRRRMESQQEHIPSSEAGLSGNHAWRSCMALVLVNPFKEGWEADIN